jgi:two-component system sensor histidine kinase UhpB
MRFSSLLNRTRMPLLWQLFVPNALVLVTATLVLMLSPATISSPPTLGEGVVIFAGLLGLLGVNLWIISRTLAPLGELTEAMRNVDPLQPGGRVSIRSHADELLLLSDVFNRMLARLETERRDSGRRMLAAQEEERRRIARELHDEVGQSTAALMLELGHLAKMASGELAKDLIEVREETRRLSADIQAIVRQLRPDALDDLGLGSALTHLSESFADRFGIKVERHLAANLPHLDPAAELVVYRVAQESLTNVGRHSGAGAARLDLSVAGSVLRLEVADDGVGMNGAPPGSGIRGMRERAILLDAALVLNSSPGEGTTVRLDVPLQPA